MNYLEIVLMGYLDLNSREHLGNYFFRECKKVEAQHFEAVEFFQGCVNVANTLEKIIQDLVYKRKHDIYLMMSDAENSGMSQSERKQKIESLEEALADAVLENFSVHLPSITKGLVFGQLWIDDINQIRIGFMEAIKMIEKSSQSTNLEKKSLTPPKVNTDKLKSPILGLFCRLVNESGIDDRGETESARVYCKRICDKFKLPYVDRVRQNYYVKETKTLMHNFYNKILPLIDAETKRLILKYIDSKQPPNQNLYG